MQNGEKQENRTNWLLIIGAVIVILLLVGIGLLAVNLLRGSPQPEPAGVASTPELTPAAQSTVQVTGVGTVVIQSYSVAPERIIAGGCADITWAVQNADLIQLKENNTVILDAASSSQTYRTCPASPGNYVYRLQVSNTAGSSNWMELQVIVDPADQASGSTSQTPAPTDVGSTGVLPQATGPVTINKFNVEPQRTSTGGCATIYWEVMNADQIQLLRDGAAVVPDAQLQGSFEDCFSAAAIYQYRLEAKNSEGNYNVLELQVIVE